MLREIGDVTDLPKTMLREVLREIGDVTDLPKIKYYVTGSA